MKRSYTTVLCFCLVYASSTLAQNKGDILISVNAGMRKTIQHVAPLDDFFQASNVDGFQVTTDVNFFCTRKLTASLGNQVTMNDNGNQSHVTIGTRYYVFPGLFLRARYHSIKGSDISTGVGYAIPFGARLRMEVMGDYLCIHSMITLQGGLAYCIQR
jgi:hypothetical protein